MSTCGETTSDKAISVPASRDVMLDTPRSVSRCESSTNRGDSGHSGAGPLLTPVRSRTAFGYGLESGVPVVEGRGHHGDVRQRPAHPHGDSFASGGDGGQRMASDLI